ncbi:MAG: hypothetical protein JSS27_12745 [Planctomycetes bacterium]|nr:hypothetical protein [Planctomycetota bacterium]
MQPARINITPPARRLSDLALVVLFILGCFAPLTALNRPGVGELIERTENRRAAKFPDVETKRYGLVTLPRTGVLRTFPLQFESWFNDHLGARRSLIRLYNLGVTSGVTTQQLTRTSNKEVRGSIVMIGRNGWLFSTIDDSTADYRCLKPFTPPQLDQWQQVFAARQQWLAARGIRYVLMVCPNQQTVYSEHLPLGMTRVNPQSRWQQLSAHLQVHTNLAIVDPCQRLIDGKANWPTYHKTDNHWNDYGGYLGYRQTCETLVPWFPQLRPASLDDFTVSRQAADGRLLAVAIESIRRYSEDLVTLTPKQPRQTKSGPADWSKGYSDFTSSCPTGEIRRVVMLHDSFGEAIGPYLAEHFQHVRYLGVNTGFPADIIAQEQPDLVIQETVERRFMVNEPSNPPQVEYDLQLVRQNSAQPR